MALEVGDVIVAIDGGDATQLGAAVQRAGDVATLEVISAATRPTEDEVDFTRSGRNRPNVDRACFATFDRTVLSQLPRPKQAGEWPALDGCIASHSSFASRPGKGVTHIADACAASELRSGDEARLKYSPSRASVLESPNGLFGRPCCLIAAFDKLASGEAFPPPRRAPP